MDWRYVSNPFNDKVAKNPHEMITEFGDAISDHIFDKHSKILQKQGYQTSAAHYTLREETRLISATHFCGIVISVSPSDVRSMAGLTRKGTTWNNAIVFRSEQNVRKERSTFHEQLVLRHKNGFSR